MRAFLGVICIIGLSQAYPSNDFSYATSTSNQLNGLNGYLPPGGSDYNQQQYEEPLITKHFYIHSAPEEEENSQPKRLLLGRASKNYRVVFIRAPSASKQRLSAEFAPQEDKTVIYVLSQKEHDIDVDDIATPAPTEPSKPEVFFIKYKTPEEAIHAQQQIQGGWRALGMKYGSSVGFQIWDYKKALIYIQSIYGTFPFYKISVTKRLTPPFGNIIYIHEGETGLPHRMFYNLENNHKIINAYKMLLRDFAINMGVVSEESELFADEIFHYEKRIANQIILTEKLSSNKINEIKKLGELKNIAPSLPIFEAVQAIFSKTKITEETEVLIENANVLQAMSIIISTSDKQPLNDFIIWSMTRKLLPYLSREYSILVEKYEQELFGTKAVVPNWYYCTEIARNMMAFAVDVLQENSTLETAKLINSPEKSSIRIQRNKFTDELFKLIFYHIRNEMQLLIRTSEKLNETSRTYILDKLSTIKLQLGLPSAALESPVYVNQYYENLLLQNLFFAENLESFWNFKKGRMEKSLKPPLLVDLVIAELYANERPQPISFSPNMNMAIISRRLLTSPYFNYKYPIALNFARIGNDIAEFFLNAVSLYLIQDEKNITIPLKEIFNIKCLTNQIVELNETLPHSASVKMFNKILATKLSFSAFSSFLNAFEKSEPIVGMPVSEISYADMGLSNPKRQAGLRFLNEQQYFALATLQRHCSVSHENYNKFKPFMGNEIPESQMFHIVWNYVPYLPNSFYCSPERSKCFKIL